MKLFLSELNSPLGTLLLVTDAQMVVRALDFDGHKARLHRGMRDHYGDVHLTEIRHRPTSRAPSSGTSRATWRRRPLCGRRRPVRSHSAASGPHCDAFRPE